MATDDVPERAASSRSVAFASLFASLAVGYWLIAIAVVGLLALGRSGQITQSAVLVLAAASLGGAAAVLVIAQIVLAVCSARRLDAEAGLIVAVMVASCFIFLAGILTVRPAGGIAAIVSAAALAVYTHVVLTWRLPRLG